MNLHLPTELGNIKDKNGQSEAVRILVMDDEATLRNLMVSMIRQFGYEVDCAQDGSEALSLYRKALKIDRKYDIVVLDLTVPGGMGGKETVQALQELNPDVKAIVCSGYADDPVLADCRKFGFAAALAKPYRPAELQRAIETLIECPHDSEDRSAII